MDNSSDDDFFDEFDWEDAVIIGSFFDYMVDQESNDEKRRKKIEEDADIDPFEDDDPYA